VLLVLSVWSTTILKIIRALFALPHPAVLIVIPIHALNAEKDSLVHLPAKLVKATVKHVLQPLTVLNSIIKLDMFWLQLIPLSIWLQLVIQDVLPALKLILLIALAAITDTTFLQAFA
jgi:hypothetical protein